MRGSDLVEAGIEAAFVELMCVADTVDAAIEVADAVLRRTSGRVGGAG